MRPASRSVIGYFLYLNPKDDIAVIECVPCNNDPRKPTIARIRVLIRSSCVVRAPRAMYAVTWLAERPFILAA